MERSPDPLSPGFYSPLFVVPKKTGGYRLIFNQKNLNQFIITHRFKMETLKSVRDCLRPGEFTVSVDLEDAYLHIPLHPSCYHLFRFCLNGVVFHFTALPFGLASAPWVFTKILRPVVAYLHTHSILVHAYLDDWLLQNPSIINIHKDLGFFLDLEPRGQSTKIPPDPKPSVHLFGNLFRPGAGPSIPYSRSTYGDLRSSSVLSNSSDLHSPG